MAINKVFISGNLTRDPELRQMPSGTEILSFSVAVNDRRKDPQSGEWRDVPNYFDCTVFGKRAKGLSNCLAKGTKVSIEGKLRWSQWEQDGRKRSKVDIVVDELELMYSQGPQSGSTGPIRQSTQPQGRQEPYSPQQLPYGDVYDSDLPF